MKTRVLLAAALLGAGYLAGSYEPVDAQSDFNSPVVSELRGIRSALERIERKLQ